MVTVATIRKHRNKFQAIIRRIGFPPKSKTFTRRADAVAWASIIESEMERGEFVDRTEADQTTLKAGLQRYLETVTPRKKGARQETARIRYWQRHKLASYSLTKIRAKDFGDWRDEELASGKSPNTVRNHFVTLSHFFNHARKEWGLPIKNPIADLWWPKKRKDRTRRFVGDEEPRLHSAAREVHAQLSAAITVLTESAMRRSELVRMPKHCLDLKRGAAHLEDTKTGEARDVPLSGKAIQAYRSLPARLDGRIWPWVPDKLTHLFHEACVKAGIKNFRLHDLRHEATSRLAKIYEVHQLAKIRGDKTLNQLMGYYHPTADELGERLAR